MKRRYFLGKLGLAAASPLVANAQQSRGSGNREQPAAGGGRGGRGGMTSGAIGDRGLQPLNGGKIGNTPAMKITDIKTFLVSLYDPGEINVAGAQMQVLDPSGAVATSCKVSKFTNPTDSTAYQVITLSPCSIPTTNSTGGALYNGQLLTIDIKIPVTYSCTFCWWKIRYDLGASPAGSPADTTTWSAAIKGDPVHLVNE